MELSVVIPAWNEANNLARLLPQLHTVLATLDCDYEIIVADNHSTDATETACAALNAICVQQSERGYGGALWAGFARARGEYILTMDADLSHLPDFVPTLWRHRSEAELLIASRYVEGGSGDMPWYRQVLSVILNQVYTKLLSLPFKDISSGFRLYQTVALRGLDLKSNDFDALEEILIKCYAQGCKVIELPFHYVPRDQGRSKVKLLHFGVSYLKTLLRMWTLRNSIASADYDARAYDSIIPLQRYWQRQRYRIVTGMVDPRKPCLDIGCGSSHILGALYEHSVGLDISRGKLLYSRRFERHLVQGSGFALPFGDGSFEQVLCSQVIEHLPASEKPFAEMTRVLQEGGRLVLGTPDYGRLSWVILERLYGFFAPGAYADEHITHYTRDGLIRLLAKYGFRFEKVGYVGGSEMILLFHKSSEAEGPCPA